MIEKRKQVFQAILWTNGVDPSEGLEDEKLIGILVDDLKQVVDGKLEPYAPIVIKMLQNWLPDSHQAMQDLSKK